MFTGEEDDSTNLIEITLSTNISIFIEAYIRYTVDKKRRRILY